MLSRPATKISLTPDDIAAYEQRKQAREALKQRQQQQHDASESPPNSEMSTIDNPDEDGTPAAQTRAKMTREQRIGV
jgi:hypothetical protein